MWIYILLWVDVAEEMTFSYIVVVYSTCKSKFIFMYEVMLLLEKISLEFILCMFHVQIRVHLSCRCLMFDVEVVLDIFYFMLYFCTQATDICVLSVIMFVCPSGYDCSCNWLAAYPHSWTSKCKSGASQWILL